MVTPQSFNVCSGEDCRISPPLDVDLISGSIPPLSLEEILQTYNI